MEIFFRSMRYFRVTIQRNTTQMKNWIFYLPEILILVLMKVSKIQAGCKWDSDSKTSQKYCSITCETSIKNIIGFESVETVLGALNGQWKKRLDCHEDGIDLKLENFVFTKNVVAKKWFSYELRVRELSISLNGASSFIGSTLVTKIDVDAFNVYAFQFTKKLTFTSFTLSSISTGIFNGLQSLEVLNIKNAEELKVIEKGVLDSLNQTLKEFSFEQSTKSVDEVLIDGFTGSENLEKIENVKFLYKLKTSITIKSFKGLKNVRTLDLSECQIVSIGGSTFDHLNSMELLNLSGNEIANISPDIFRSQLVTTTTTILLKGNKWFCNCELLLFKQSLMEHSNFFDQLELECDGPIMYRSHPLLATNFCNLTTVTSSTSTTSLTSPIPPLQVCRSPKVPGNVAIEVHKHTNMEIHETKNGDIVLQHDEIKENSVLIWFSLDFQTTYAHSINDINCLIGSGSSFRIENILSNLVYTFCLMEPMKMTVSPLDCISYTKKSDLNVWLTDNEKNRVIGITTVIYALTTLIGVTIGIVHNKLKVMTNNRNDGFIRRRKTSRRNSLGRSRHSIMSSDSYNTRRTSNATVQYFIESNNNPPPLPARPLSMFPAEEPIYATIRDVTTISTHSQLSVSYI